MTTRRRVRRALAWVGLALAFVGVFAASLGAHLRTAAGRRVAARTLVVVLDRTFQGKFELALVSELSLSSVTADGFRVRDPRGRLVLEGRGVRIRADLVAILRELFGDEGKATIAIDYARVEQANVVLAPLPGQTELGLVAAFTPRPSPPEPVSAPAPRVWLPAVELGRGSTRLELRGLPVLDGVVTGARGQVLVSPVGVAVDAARFSAVVRGLLDKELKAVGSFHQRGTTHFWSTLDGYAGDLQFDGIARLDGTHLAITLDVPRAEPKVVRELLPAWPVEQVASAHLEAAGDLPKLEAKASAAIGASSLQAAGSIELSPELRLRLETQGEGIDLRAVIPDAPETSITARTTLDLLAGESGVELTADGASEPSRLGRIPLPAATFHVTYGPEGLGGNAKLGEDGMPLSGTFRLEPGGALSLDAHAARFALEGAPRIADFSGARGQAEWRVQAKVEKQKLDGSLTVAGDNLVLGALAVRSARASGHVTGLVTAPRELKLDGTVEAHGVRWGGLAFDDANVKLTGPLGGLLVSAKLKGEKGASIEATTRLRALGRTELDDVDLVVAREGRSLHGKAGRIAVEGESIEVSALTLEGAGGTLTGSARYRPGLLELDARGQDFDLGTVGRVLGVATGDLGGKLSVNAEVALARDVRRGTVSLGLRDGAFRSVGGVNIDLATTLDGENVSGNALVELAGLGRVSSSFDAKVKGSILEAAALRGATGRLDVGIERLELPRLAPLLPKEARVGALGGVVVAQVNVVRTTPDGAPSMTVLAATQGLEVTALLGEERAPFSVIGIETQLSGQVDGTQGFAQADARFIDSHGLLLSASARLAADVKRFLAAPGSAWAWLEREPIVATAIVDGRPLAELPTWLRPPGLSGTLRAEATVRGSIAEPMLAVKAALGGLLLDESQDTRPFDVCGTLQYDPLAQRIGLGAQAHVIGTTSVPCSGTRVAVARATGTIDPPALLRGERGFDGDAELGFEDLPLELLPPLADAGMTGRVRGAVALKEGLELPALNARLRVADVSVRGIPVGTGELGVRTDGRALTLGLTLARGDGTLNADAHAALAWDRIVPRLDRTEPITAEIALHDIDAALLSPVVGSVLSDLSGRLDGSARLTLAPEGVKAAPGVATELTGELALANGALQLSGLGMRLSNVKFAATAEKHGARTVVSVRRLSAASGAKYDNVAASADIYLEGLKLVDARANVNLSRVPLLIEGVSQATLTGAAALELFPDRNPMLVAIQLHDLTAVLPRSSGRTVLAIDDNPDVIVKQPLREPARGARGGALGWQLAFDLTRKVKLQRADMEIPLKGRPVVTLADGTSVTGDLELLSGGRVELIGKGFVIESGEVHFDTEDPADPHLRVLSSWRAPDGTTVYVEVGGRLREATLRLSSDPPLSPPEIQALLLGGSGDGSDARAAGVGYGADFVGQLLADTPLKRVELRTGSETSADERNYLTYTAAMPVSENVWVELSYKNLESNSPAEHTDAASATVDWRFKRDWSLRTEAGTIGTGLDLLWQYRY
ncbi:MAG TPA: translocation/assembly module TamB domain-containing protein [Polyangiaceae bacterium]|nr:translocation/assembly module TamB domain-containing protein [Polyangiaceae bacterium]